MDRRQFIAGSPSAGALAAEDESMRILSEREFPSGM